MISLDDVIRVLERCDGWVPARYLVDVFHVSSRTVRNTIKRINQECGRSLIESSHRGYRLKDRNASSEKVGPALFQDSPDERRKQVLNRLIGANEPLCVYDLADELHVSDSTLQSDLRWIRSFVRPFNLSISKCRDCITLTGSERDRRRLINRLVCGQNPEGFIAFANEQLMANNEDAREYISIVQDALHIQDLSYNDFGLNNIVSHLSIMVERIRMGKTVSDGFELPEFDSAPSQEAASEICNKIEATIGIPISPEECSYLALIIFLNCKNDPSRSPASSMESVIDDSDLSLAKRASVELEKTYALNPFDDSFIQRLALHFYSLRQRLQLGVSMQNPLARKTKNGYPLIYDMAVLLAEIFSHETGLSLNDDEIAFLAFHVGGYFEESPLDSRRVTCSLLYVNYNDLHTALIDRIHSELGDRVIMVDTVPVSDANPDAVCSELVLSPVPVRLQSGKVVLLNPIPSDSDIENIRMAADEILRRKRKEHIAIALYQLLRPNLFKRNRYARSRSDMIRLLVDECTDNNLCDRNFFEDVTAREVLSSTTFGRKVAVPHAVSTCVHRPFLAVVVNDRPMTWGAEEVNVVILMGFSQQNRDEFKTTFIDLMHALNDAAIVGRILKVDDRDGFIQIVGDTIAQRSTT